MVSYVYNSVFYYLIFTLLIFDSIFIYMLILKSLLVQSLKEKGCDFKNRFFLFSGALGEEEIPKRKKMVYPQFITTRIGG